MATRMQQRRGTASQWTTADPVLAAGEIGVESDTAKFKIGDGINTWSNLDYFQTATAAGSTFIEDSEKGANDGVATLDGTGNVPTSQLGNVDFTGYATETYVNTAVTNLVDSAPAALDTLNELAAALNDDSDFSTTITNSIASKQDDVITTEGDLAIGDNTGTAVRLPIGAADTVLTSNGTTATWEAAGGGAIAYQPPLSGGTSTISIAAGTYGVNSDALYPIVINGQNINADTNVLKLDNPATSITFESGEIGASLQDNSLPFNQTVQKPDFTSNLYLTMGNSGENNVSSYSSTDNIIWEKAADFSTGAGTNQVRTKTVTDGTAFYFGDYYTQTMVKTTAGVSFTVGANIGARVDDVAYGNGVYIAMNRNNAALYTTTDSNLTGFTTVSIPGGFNITMRQIVYVNGFYVVLGGDGVMWTSTDASNFTQQSDMGAGDISALVYDGTNYIVGGRNGIFYSSTIDGTYTQALSLSSTDIEDLAYDNNIYLALDNSNQVYSSSDGINWTQVNTISVGEGIYNITLDNNVATFAGGNTTFLSSQQKEQTLILSSTTVENLS